MTQIIKPPPPPPDPPCSICGGHAMEWVFQPVRERGWWYCVQCCPN